MTAKETTTLAGWKAPEGLDEKLKNDIKRIPELGQEGYEHKREQLYLMYADGRSDQFLDFFRKEDLTISSATMDIVRMTAKLCGEEFAQSTLMYRSFTLDEVVGKITDELTKRRYENLPDIQAKLNVVSALEEELSQMKAFFQKMKRAPEGQKDLRELERKLHEKETELKAKDMEIVSLSKESEMKLASVRAEYEGKIRYMKLAFQRELERAIEKERSMNQGGRFWRRNRTAEAGNVKPEISDESLALFLVKVLSDNRYKEEQLDVITEAVGDGLPIEEIRCICKPEMSASGMRRLKAFFQKRKEEGYGV